MREELGSRRLTLHLPLPDPNASTAYKVGESVTLECKSWDKSAWGPGPVCKETGKPLSLSFGVDNFLFCNLEVADAVTYGSFRDIVAQTKPWHCRVPVEPGGSHFAPLVVPVWGVVEGDHLHVDNHVHVVFHADAGRIIAAAAYPVRDRFQFVKQGSVISLHGAVRWFKKDTYTPLGGGAGGIRGRIAALAGAAVSGKDASGQSAEGCSPAVVAAWSAASALLVRHSMACFSRASRALTLLTSSVQTLAGLTLLYEQHLKPSVIRRCLKAR